MEWTNEQLQALITLSLTNPNTENQLLESYNMESEKLIGHPNPYYKLFFLIAKTLRPKLSVELGAWRGYGAAHFAVGNPDGLVATVDIHREDDYAKQRCIEMALKFNNLHYFNYWTWDALAHMQERYGDDFAIDILFIDAWHKYDYVWKEWFAYSPYLADNAMIICDDLFDDAAATEEMLKFWNEFTQLDCISDPVVNGSVHWGVPMGFARYIELP